MIMSYLIKVKKPSLFNTGGSYLGGSLLNELDDFFESPFSTTFFKNWDTETEDINLKAKETDSAYHIQANLPGFKKEEIAIKIENGSLELSAKKEKNEKDDGHFEYADVSKSVYLGDVDLKNSTAELKDGILSLTLKKPESKQAQRLEIK